MNKALIIFVILAVVALDTLGAPTNSSTTEDPAPKHVIRVLSPAEIEASNKKARGAENLPRKTGKTGKRIRNNSRFEDVSKDSNIAILKINTIDAATQKTIPHPGQKVRPAPGKQTRPK